MTNHYLKSYKKVVNRKGVLTHRQCVDCKKLKDVSCFPERLEKRKDGKCVLGSICKPCLVKRSVAWYTKNKERYAKYQYEYQKKYRKLHLDQVRARERARYHKNKHVKK